MGKVCPADSKELSVFAGFLDIKVARLKDASADICMTGGVSDDTRYTLKIVRERLSNELQDLVGYTEITECLLDAMSVLRRVPTGDFVWKVFGKETGVRCKYPRSDYNRAFLAIRSQPKKLWELTRWTARKAYFLPDAARILLLYELFLRDPEKFSASHEAAAHVYKDLITQTAEYLNPDFAPWIVEYLFHIGSAARGERELLPLSRASKAVKDMVYAKLHELKDISSMKNLLSQEDISNVLVDNCAHLLESDKEALIVVGSYNSENLCKSLCERRR